MASFGRSSREKLATCDERLQRLFNEVVKTHDCTVLCGHRNEEDQEKAFREGRSHAHYGQSKHNTIPSVAADIVPYPIDWNDLDRFNAFIAFVLNTAMKMNIRVRSGAFFSNLKDYPHFELIDE